jgi:putative restriction endonuclease
VIHAVTNAVFTTKIDPTYDDLPEFRYHFPRTYLRQVEAAVGDWIVYYEPRRTSGDFSSRGGRQSYFATARVTSVQPDSANADHFYAFVSDFLEFDRPVPFKEGDHYYEAGLQRADGGTNRGAFGRAVRLITDDEFNLVLKSGFDMLLAPMPATGSDVPGFADEPATLERPLVQRVSSRPFRDAAFSVAVKSAYGKHLCLYWAEDTKWRRQIRSPGRTHPARGRFRAGLGSQRSGVIRYCPLDVRPRAAVS